MPRRTITKELNDLVPETSSQRILLEEFRSLQSRFLNLQEEGATRLNFFITAASFSLGGLLVFGSNNQTFPEIYFRIALLVVLLVLGILDWYICMFFAQRDILADRYERGLIRIRQYFIKLDPLIENYFVTRVIEEPTPNIVRNNSGMRRAAQIIGSFLLGLATTVALTFTSFRIEMDMASGSVTGVLVFLVLEFTAQRRYRRAVLNVREQMKLKKANEM